MDKKLASQPGRNDKSFSSRNNQFLSCVLSIALCQLIFIQESKAFSLKGVLDAGKNAVKGVADKASNVLKGVPNAAGKVLGNAPGALAKVAGEVPGVLGKVIEGAPAVLEGVQAGAALIGNVVETGAALFEKSAKVATQLLDTVEKSKQTMDALQTKCNEVFKKDEVDGSDALTLALPQLDPSVASRLDSLTAPQNPVIFADGGKIPGSADSFRYFVRKLASNNNAQSGSRGVGAFVSLANSNLTGEILKSFLTELAQFPDVIGHLNLANNPLNDADARILAEFLPRLGLHSLVLSGTHMTLAGVEQILQAGRSVLQYCDFSNLQNFSQSEMAQFEQLQTRYPLWDGLVVPTVNVLPPYQTFSQMDGFRSSSSYLPPQQTSSQPQSYPPQSAAYGNVSGGWSQQY
ncbi:MAG: hypothetical protein LBC25_00575 [Holosporales bacterium]|jgi:hypothetical protein|nr:hypothetical protein [Holosporales bacterium]